MPETGLKCCKERGQRPQADAGLTDLKIEDIKRECAAHCFEKDPADLLSGGKQGER